MRDAVDYGVGIAARAFGVGPLRNGDRRRDPPEELDRRFDAAVGLFREVALLEDAHRIRIEGGIA